MAGILETEMLQPCSFSMSGHDTQHHTTPTSLWTRAAWPCHLASWILSIKRHQNRAPSSERAEKNQKGPFRPFSLPLINAEIVRCWIFLWNSTIPSRNLYNPTHPRETEPTKKTHRQILGSTHYASIPLDIGYIFPSIKGTRCRSKTSPGISSGGGRFRFLNDQRPGGQTTDSSICCICLNKLECQFY